MFSKERQAIDGLFKHIREVAEQSGPREPQAEALIEHHMERIPGAAYYLAQVVLVQRQALLKAEERFAELERQRGAAPAGPAPRPQAAAPQGAAGVQPPLQPRQSGFLEGAAQTALGVGGGILMAGAATELARGIFGGADYSAGDLFDAHSAGYKEALADLDTYDAGYEDAAYDLGDDLSGADLDFGFDDW
jgi:hypothetical protein